nr:M24 family metallopeptidase [Brooklawnia cerclae]
MITHEERKVTAGYPDTNRDFVAARLRGLLEREGLDALVSVTGTDTYYLSGYGSLYGAAPGTILGIAYKDSADPRPTVISTETEVEAVLASGAEAAPYPTFMFLDDPFGRSSLEISANKPRGFGLAVSAPIVADALRRRGVKGRIGVQERGLDTASLDLLRGALTEWEIVEASELLVEARVQKSAEDIEYLGASVAITEDIISQIVSEIDQESSARSITSRFKELAFAHPEVDDIRLCLVTVGTNFAPTYIAREQDKALPGAVIKFDVGVTVGYHGADIGRTFVIGDPSDHVERVYAALLQGHEYLRSVIAPGVSFREAFDGGMDVIKSAGLPHYTRGHLGHSVGLGPSPEEHPVLGDVDGQFREGMVFCVETPYYGFGVGCLQLEDMLVVTEDGNRNLNKLPHELTSI